MNNCECTPKYIPGYHRVPHKRPCPPQPRPEMESCSRPNFIPACSKPDQITLRTVTLPPQLGTDETGEPYAPKLAQYFNTVVYYQANGAAYVYDSNGMYTKIYPSNYDQLVEQVDGLETALKALQEKEQSDIDNLQININNVMNKEIMDVDNLQININKLAEELEEYKNSPDVRYITDTYTELEAIDKNTIGDQDYARVLQDETHENASTYYQFNKTDNEWAYVGQTGPYYTKQEIDSMIGDVQSLLTKLDTGEGV